MWLQLLLQLQKQLMPTLDQSFEKVMAAIASNSRDNGNQGKAHKKKLSAFKKRVKDHCNKLITLWIDSKNPMCPFADDAASDIA